MFDPTPWISKALSSEGGHMFINRGGFCLNYDNGTLSGYQPDAVKRQSIASGLPVCDASDVDPSVIFAIASSGPMIAVGRDADPHPWRPHSYAPLYAVFDAYRRAGAEVHNMPPSHVGPIIEHE